MHRAILYYQPAVPVIVAILILLAELNQVFPKPLANLDHKGNGTEEDFVPHGSYDEYRC